MKGENSRCPPLSGATLPLHSPKSDGLLTLCPGALLTSRRLGPVFNLPEVQVASCWGVHTDLFPGRWVQV